MMAPTSWPGSPVGRGGGVRPALGSLSHQVRLAAVHRNAHFSPPHPGSPEGRERLGKVWSLNKCKVEQTNERVVKPYVDGLTRASTPRALALLKELYIPCHMVSSGQPRAGVGLRHRAGGLRRPGPGVHNTKVHQ